jgi:hypothetical protein
LRFHLLDLLNTLLIEGQGRHSIDSYDAIRCKHGIRPVADNRQGET